MIPDITVLMTVWNTPSGFVNEAITSVREQKGCEWELVIVDDGSENLEIAPQHLMDHRVDIYHRKHAGVGASANFGLTKAKSELVARMGADDVMLPDRLRWQVEYMSENPNLDVLSGQMVNVGPDLAVIEYTKYRLNKELPVPDQYVVADGTVCYRKRSVLQTPSWDFEADCQRKGPDGRLWYGYDENDWRGCDYRLWKSMWRDGCSFQVVNRYFLLRRIWPGSFSFDRSGYCQSRYENWERQTSKRWVDLEALGLT